MYKDLMIQACFWSSTFYSMSYPFIHLYIMKDASITEKVISSNQIFICLTIIIINSIWNKHSSKLYKYYKAFILIESIAYLVLTIGAISTTLSPLYYYTIDFILFGFISRNVICGANKLRAFIYNGETREKYDNTISIASAIATLIGSFIAIIINIPIEVAFAISWIGLVIDNIFYWIAYNKTKIQEE